MKRRSIRLQLVAVRSRTERTLNPFDSGVAPVPRSSSRIISFHFARVRGLLLEDIILDAVLYIRCL